MRVALAVAAFGVPMLLSCQALADRIDGAWCLKVERMVIDGPNIQTPGGIRTTGDYSRHAFRYTVPAGEQGAGGEVHMILHSEDEVAVQRGGTPELWHRCGPDIS
jgi:hypothetical protein